MAQHKNMKEEDIKNEEEITEKTDAIETNDDVTFEELNEDGEIDSKMTIKKLREKIKKLEGEKKEYLGGWQRAQADYVNLKRESEEKRKADIRFATKNLIRELLPTLDAYDMAKSNKEAWEKVDQNWRVGIEYIFGQLISVLANEGALQYGRENDTFDPELHESIEMVLDEDKDKNGKIALVLQSGYKMGDSILRVARVKVFQTE